LKRFEVRFKREIAFVVDAKDKDDAIKEASILLDQAPESLFDLDSWDIEVKEV